MNDKGYIENNILRYLTDTTMNTDIVSDTRAKVSTNTDIDDAPTYMSYLSEPTPHL